MTATPARLRAYLPVGGARRRGFPKVSSLKTPPLALPPSLSYHYYHTTRRTGDWHHCTTSPIRAKRLRPRRRGRSSCRRAERTHIAATHDERRRRRRDSVRECGETRQERYENTSSRRASFRGTVGTTTTLSSLSRRGAAYTHTHAHTSAVRGDVCASKRACSRASRRLSPNVTAIAARSGGRLPRDPDLVIRATRWRVPPKSRRR